MTCATCDHILPPERLFCPTCGTPAGGPPVEPGVRTYPVRGVGVAAIVAVLVVLLASVVVQLFPLIGSGMAEQAMRTGDVDPLNQAAVLEGVLSVPYLLALLTAAVLVIIWLWRARKNLAAFPGAPQGMRAGWAIGGWFIPFANLVIPYKVMANVASASLWRSKYPLVVQIWWASYLIAGFLNSRAAFNDTYLDLPTVIETRADFQQYVDYYQSLLPMSLVILALTGVAGALLIRLIATIGRAQEDRISRGRSGPLMPGATVAPAQTPE